MKTIIVLAIILVTYFILKYVQVILKRLSKKNNFIRNVNRILPLVVGVIWLVIVFWSANYLIDYKSYYNFVVLCMIIVLSVLIGWFFIKDFIAGIIFRIQNNYSEGDFLQFGETAGKIEALFPTHISVNTKEGKIVKLPYSRLSNEIISQKTTLKTFEENTYILKTNKNESCKLTEDIIKNTLLVSPWRIGNKQPEVQFIEEDDHFYSFKIQLQVRNQKHLSNLKEILEKKFRSE